MGIDHNGPVTFIDLFAGIGGMRLALEEEGAVCVFSSEWDKFCRQTYAANFYEIPQGDINSIKESDIPGFDILVAGFPCQSFSRAGLKKGFNDPRGNVFFEIIRIAKYHRPKVIFLENVKNLVLHDKGETFKVILNSLKELEYTVHYKILNAKDFGLPQNRERIYIVAFREETHFQFPQPFNQPTCIDSILEPFVDKKYTLTDIQWEYHQKRKKLHKEKGNGFGYVLVNKNASHTGTLTAHYTKDGSEILIDQSPLNPRRLTVREAARLQGFPDSFIIPVSNSQAYKQLGNSVAISVIKAIARQIIKQL